MNSTLEPRITCRRPGRRKIVDTEKNAIYGLRMLCGLTTDMLGRLIGRPQSHISRAELQGIGLGPVYWLRLEDVFGESRYEIRDPQLTERIKADPNRLKRMQARVAQKTADYFAECAKKICPE